MSVALVCAIALVDYATGYEVRLAVLYVVPIAVATWTVGRGAGLAIAVLSTGCWMTSFRTVTIYSQKIYFLWEAVAMLAGLVLFTLLLARLRTALAQADERFLRVLEEMYAGVCVADHRTGRILYANWRLAKMLESDPFQETLASLEARFSLSNPPDGADDAGGVRGGDRSRFSSREVRSKANGRWYLLQTGPIPWEPGQEAELKVMTDITEQKQAQALQRKHQEVLNLSARHAALAEIASMVSHEINQPLMAIASYNDACLRLLANERYDKADVVAALEKCRRQSARAGEIIVRLREFIRRRHASPAQFDLNAMISEAVELTQFHWEEHGISVSSSLANRLPAVFADRALALQVVVNLIQNAVDAMQSVPQEERRLDISTGVSEDGEILVAVKDRGEGIAEEHLEHLYAPFFTTKPQGMGLGLAICRSVVEAHGGRLWAMRNADRGCTFQFTIPAEL